MNTCPHNFIWEKDKTGIIVVASGLYEISFGFYSRMKPEIQFSVNNEVVICSTNANNSKAGTWSEQLHSSSNVTGNFIIF